MVLVNVDFDERDPLYLCCCERITIKKGAQILAVFHAAFGIFQFVKFLFIKMSILWAASSVLQGVTQVASSILMILAVQLGKPRFVIPYLVVQLILLLSDALIFVIFLLSIFLPESVGKFAFQALVDITQDYDIESEDTVSITIISAIMIDSFKGTIVCFAIFCLELWTLRVSFQCYNYLLDVRDAREGTHTLPPLRFERSPSE
ncbi:hypothetical protein PFISCL1PPCAC_14507, partial [Pristionchus fissidentatus]